MADWTLWGFHSRYIDGVPLKLTGGNMRHCRSELRYREKLGGWTLAIYRAGTSPDGLRDQAAQARITYDDPAAQSD